MIWKYNDMEVFYTVVGKGKPLLLVPGWGSDHTIYGPLVNILKKRFKLYLIDLPGWGRSFPPGDVWGSYDYANMVSAFINEIINKDCFILGHSFGGKVSILVMKQNSNVKKGVLISSSGVRLPLSPAKAMKVKMFKFIKKIFPESIIEEFRDRFGSDDYRNAKGIMRKILVKVVNENIKDELKDVKQPVLLIWGDKDTATPLKIGNIMKSLMPNAQLVIMKGADHFPFLENPVFVAKHTEAFLKDE